MNAFQALFCSESLLPHGFCYLWNPLLIWLHGVSDTLIAGAYFSIPPTLIYLVRKKKSIPLRDPRQNYKDAGSLNAREDFQRSDADLIPSIVDAPASGRH